MAVSPHRNSFWPVPIARAIPALTIGLVITFSSDHTARLGLISFGIFALLGGAVVGVGSFRLVDRTMGTVMLVQATATVVFGILALISAAVASGELGYLVLLVSAFAAVTGFLELYLGLRARGRNKSSQDWLVVGTGTAVTALLYLLFPLDPVQAVGIFGAYSIVVGLYLVIAGLSLKWSGSDTNQKTSTKRCATIENSESTA